MALPSVDSELSSTFSPSSSSSQMKRSADLGEKHDSPSPYKLQAGSDGRGMPRKSPSQTRRPADAGGASNSPRSQGKLASANPTDICNPPQPLLMSTPNNVAGTAASPKPRGRQVGPQAGVMSRAPPSLQMRRPAEANGSVRRQTGADPSSFVSGPVRVPARLTERCENTACCKVMKRFCEKKQNPSG
jgi:hypothetical protein